MEIKYPTWRYHASLPARIVNGPEEDAALGPEWADTPAAFQQQPEQDAQSNDEGEPQGDDLVPLKRGPGRPRKIR
jgi:hypothetical protein